MPMLEKGRHTRMACDSINLLEPDTKQVLIDFQNGGDDHSDREILFDDRVVEVQSVFNELSVVVAVIMDIKFAIER